MPHAQWQACARVCTGAESSHVERMNSDELKILADPAKLSLPLQALWFDSRGEWERAHEVCQQAKNRDGDWVHAYLHRKEGDLGNAGYWYARAGRKAPDATLSLD